MNNKETSQAASEASNTDVSPAETPSVDNAPVASDETQNNTDVESKSSDVSPVVAVSDAESTASDTTQPLPSIASPSPSPEALEAKPASPPVVETPPAIEETMEATTSNEEAAKGIVEPSGSNGATTQDAVQTSEPTPSQETSTSTVEASHPAPQQPVLPGDAVYTDHQGNKHGAFIEHLIAGGAKLIAQLRLALGGYIDEVPHSTDGEPHSWHRN